MKLSALENQIVFCKRPWQLPLVLFPLAVLLLFGWAFYLYDDELEEFEVESYAVSNFFSSLSSDTTPQSGLVGGINVAGPQMDLVGSSSSAVVSVIHQSAGVVSSGVLVHPDGYVVTTLHSVNNPDQLQIRVSAGAGSKLYRTEIVKKHPAHDLVMLKMVTNDRFLYLKLAESRQTALQSSLIAIGRSAEGQVVANPGVLQLNDQVRQVAGNPITHLMQSNALMRWEQGGGAVINPQAELVGVGLLLQGEGGTTEGFVVPAHVIRAHFQDVVDLTAKGLQRRGKAAADGVTTAPAQPVEPAAPRGLAAAWWDNARQQARQERLAAAQQLQQQSDPSALLAQNVAAVTATPADGQQRVAHIGAPGDSVSLMDLEHDSSFDLGFYKLDAILGLILLGLFAGAVGTLVPMGGGIFAVAGMMLVLGYGVFMVRPVIYITNLFTYGLAALRQLFAGVVITRRIKELLPATIVGAVLGYFLGHNLYDHVIGYLVGGFAFAMAVVVYFELRGDLQERDSHIRPVAKSQEDRIDNFLLDSEERDLRAGWASSPIMGAPLGILTGLLGVSGGVVEQYFQRKYAGLSAENARANAIVMVFWASLTATLVSLGYGVSIGSFEWQTPLTLAMILVPSTYGGGFLGYRLQERTTLTQQRWTFIGIMGAVGAALLLFQ